jgi:hypothetical protein
MNPTTNDVKRFNSYADKTNVLGCWPWQGAVNSSGYGKFWMGGQTVPAHRVSFILHQGPIPDGSIIVHSCADRTCVNPAHLQAGTHRQNMQDMVLKGNSLKGEKNFSAKLTQAQVQNIILSLQQKVPHRVLARTSGVSRNTIRGIATKRIWTHVWNQMAAVLKAPSSAETQI